MALSKTRRAVALALTLAIVMAGAAVAAAQPASYFTQANVQTHTTAVPFGNGAFSRSLVTNSTSYATNYQEFVDPVKDNFGNPRRFEVAYAASDLANGHLRAKVKGDLRVSGVNGGVIVLASSSIGDRFSIHRTPIFGAVPGDSVTFKLRVTAAATTVVAVPGADPSLFFNSSALGLVIYKPGTLDAGIPFVTPNVICEFFWGLGPDARLGGFPLEGTLTSYPADIQATCDLSVGGYSDFDWALFLKPAVGTLSAGSSVDFDFSQSIDATFVVPENSTVTSASGFVPGVTARSTAVFLRGEGATANPAALFLDTAPPIAAQPKTKDSGVLRFAGGNPWKEIGAWRDSPFVFEGGPALDAFGALRAFIGLVNSDDQGAKVDLKVEVFKNEEASPIAQGTLRCIAGLTRDPNKAIEAVVGLSTTSSQEFGPDDSVRVVLSARMGTTEAGAQCSRASAVGVRAYFDGARRDSRLEVFPSTPVPTLAAE